jgi:molybdenum cofactor guanylyltransferase
MDEDTPPFSCEICILAGGRSQRMGVDKAHLKLGARSMLARIKTTARRVGLPVRVITKDLLPGRGPLGGVHAALSTTTKDVLLFLSCDMPFLETDLLSLVLKTAGAKPDPVFTTAGWQVGFPFLLPLKALPCVTELLRKGPCSIQNLARTLRAISLHPPPKYKQQLLNINTPAQLKSARRRLEMLKSKTK